MSASSLDHMQPASSSPPRPSSANTTRPIHQATTPTLHNLSESTTSIPRSWRFRLTHGPKHVLEILIDRTVVCAYHGQAWFHRTTLRADQNTRRMNEDVELGKPPGSPSSLQNIPTHDGTVSDPEPLPKLPPGQDPPKPFRAKEKKPKRGYMLFPDEPPFKEWFREARWDLLAFALCGALSLALYTAIPTVTQHFFPVPVMGGPMLWPHLAYPHRNEYVNSAVSALASFFLPFIVIGLVGIFLIGSFWDNYAAIMGVSYALSAATLFQALLKWLIGGPRPHFYEVCQPDLRRVARGIGASGYLNTFYDQSVCRASPRRVKGALDSFPSGHSTAAFAGFVFLSLWLNAKFKIFADYRSYHWQLVVFAAPILAACLVAGSKIMDRYHHWSDIIAGAIIGTLFAIWGYRMAYSAVWNYRYNHIPVRSVRQAPDTHPDAPSPEPIRFLTAINFAGWQNKRAQPSPPYTAASQSPPQAPPFSPSLSKEAQDHTPYKRSTQPRPETDGTTNACSSRNSSIAELDESARPSTNHLGVVLPSLGSSLHVRSGRVTPIGNTGLNVAAGSLRGANMADGGVGNAGRRVLSESALGRVSEGMD